MANACVASAVLSSLISVTDLLVANKKASPSLTGTRGESLRGTTHFRARYAGSSASVEGMTLDALCPDNGRLSRRAIGCAWLTGPFGGCGEAGLHHSRLAMLTAAPRTLPALRLLVRSIGVGAQACQEGQRCCCGARPPTHTAGGSAEATATGCGAGCGTPHRRNHGNLWPGRQSTPQCGAAG